MRTPSGAVNVVVTGARGAGGGEGGYWRSGGCGGRSCLSAGRMPARSAAPPCRRWIGYKVESTPRIGRFNHRESTSRRRRKGASPRRQYPPLPPPTPLVPHNGESEALLALLVAAAAATAVAVPGCPPR